jgi:hypothetical protein
MAEKETPKPLLIDGLSLPEKIMLGQTSLTPGFQILIKLMEAACDDSRVAINDVNPEDPGYEQVLKARQQYSRAINKFSALVLKSVHYHTEYGIAEERQKELEALQVVRQD